LQLVHRPQDGAEFVGQHNLRFLEFVRSLGFLGGDLRLSTSLQELKLKLLQLLRRTLDCRLIVKLRETLTPPHLVEAGHEHILEPRLNDGAHRR